MSDEPTMDDAANAIRRAFLVDELVCYDRGEYDQEMLHQVLQTMRKRAGLSVQEVADEIGVSRTMAAYLETHTPPRRPRIDLVHAWARACGCGARLVFTPNAEADRHSFTATPNENEG